MATPEPCAFEDVTDGKCPSEGTFRIVLKHRETGALGRVHFCERHGDAWSRDEYVLVTIVRVTP